MILTKYLIGVFLLLSCHVAVAAPCETFEDFQFQETITRWEYNRIQEKTYVYKTVPSQIGEFQLRVKGGVYRYQQFEFNQYVCSTPGNGQAFRYTRESLLNSDPAQEDIESIVVTFPNEFEMKITREELKDTKYEITTEGLKENSPFAPKGVLAAKEAILVIGKMKLSKEDSDRLKEVF